MNRNKMLKVCELCDEEFLTSSPYGTNQRFCCYEHKIIFLSKGKVCKICEKPIYKRDTYCNRKCMALDYMTRLLGDNNGNYGHGKKISELWKDKRSKYWKVKRMGCFNNNWKNGIVLKRKWKSGYFDEILKNRKQTSYLWSKGAYYKGIWMRSTWELAYAKYLDALKIRWQHEPKMFVLRNGQRYIPDFYLPDKNEWHEVKGWMDKRGESKIRRFKQTYPSEKLIIINKEIWK